MAALGMGIFYLGVIVGIPVVTGVAEGVSHQKKLNEEAANETRMSKFYLDCFCSAKSSRRGEVDGSMVVLRDEKVWLAPKNAETGLPLPLKDGTTPHPFTGFFIQYPDEDRSPPERGLVSTVSDDPPMLNWIYASKATYEFKTGNRTQSINDLVGEWDWTEDESGMLLEGWEGFVAVEEDDERADGLRWALYYDRDDDLLGKGKKVGGRRVLPCSLDRRLLPEELIKEQERETDKKLQVKSEGDLKTQWG